MRKGGGAHHLTRHETIRILIMVMIIMTMMMVDCVGDNDHNDKDGANDDGERCW